MTALKIIGGLVGALAGVFLLASAFAGEGQKGEEKKPEEKPAAKKEEAKPS